MNACFETVVKNVGVGDQIISPLSGRRLLVREVENAEYGLIDLSCLDMDGDRISVALDANERIKVIDS